MDLSTRNLVAGIAGGLAGGVVFGVMMTAMDMMGMVAALANSSSIAVGWVVHLVISAAFGVAFAAVVGTRVTGAAPAAGIGAVYGIIAWIVGALLAMPLMMGMTPFMIGEMQLMSMVGHVMFGVVLGVVHLQFVRASSSSVASRA